MNLQISFCLFHFFQFSFSVVVVIFFEGITQRVRAVETKSNSELGLCFSNIIYYFCTLMYNEAPLSFLFLFCLSVCLSVSTSLCVCVCAFFSFSLLSLSR